MGFLSDIKDELSDFKDKLSDAADEAEDRIQDKLDALKDAFEEEADRFWFKFENTKPYVAFAVTSAADDLSEWYDANSPRVERIVAKLERAAEDAYIDSGGDIRDAAKTFLKSAAVAKAELRLKDLVDEAKSFDLDAYLDNLYV